MRGAIAASLVCLVAPTASSAAHPAITLSTATGPIEMAAADAEALSPRLRWLIDTCSLNSIDHPSVFAGRDPVASWDEARARPHLLARFDTPFAVNGRQTREPIVVSEVLVPLRVGGPYWFTRRHGIVVQHTKCAPASIASVLCAAAVRGHIDPQDARDCGRRRR